MGDSSNYSGQIVLHGDVGHGAGQVEAPVRPDRTRGDIFRGFVTEPPLVEVISTSIQSSHCTESNMWTSASQCVPGDGADCELGRRLRLMHEQLQVDRALVPGDGHHRVHLALVTVVEQPGDQPGGDPGGVRLEQT